MFSVKRTAILDHDDDDAIVAESQRDFRHVGLTRYIHSNERSKDGASYQFAQLIIAIKTALKSVSANVRKQGLAQMYIVGSHKAISWHELKVGDKTYNQLFVSMISESFSACLIASKENYDITRVEADKAGKYVVILNAIDGPVSIDSSPCFGSTFTIFKRVNENILHDKEVLQSGSEIVAAGYALYGSSTVFVFTLGNGTGVQMFTYDQKSGEFILTNANVKIPRKSNAITFNEGSLGLLDKPLLDWINSKKTDDSVYFSQYVGSTVGDFHRTLFVGGLYMVPSTADSPTGKLRLIFECNPMAFILQEAGGKATNGKELILDIRPEKLKEKSPFYAGSLDNVDEIMTVTEPKPSL